MAPELARNTPAAMPISVDLPAPFSPTMACTSPGMIRTSTPLSACTGPKLLRMSASVMIGTCDVTATLAASKTSCMAEPPGDFGKRHAAENDDRVGEVLGGTAEAERRHQLREIGQKERADDGRHHASLGDAAKRITADDDGRNGAKQIRQPAQHRR